MASAESISGFDEQGSSALIPVYRFNALAISALAPPGAHIVDLGSGTGRFLAYLAAHRPDLQITGLDSAADAVRLGRRHLVNAGIDGRVQLMHGDMREFGRVVPARIDLVSSVFSLHHLTTGDDLRACLRQIAAAICSRHARLWIFDHARPRRFRTAEDTPEIFTPGASRVFREDSRNSLRAAWTFGELGAALRQTFPAKIHAARSKLLPLYQIHWTAPRAIADGLSRSARWVEGEDLPSGARRDAHLFSLLFRGAPGKPGWCADWGRR